MNAQKGECMNEYSVVALSAVILWKIIQQVTE